MTGKVTNESVDLGFTVPEGYTTSKLDDGSLVFYPSKGIDPTKSLDSQVLHYAPAGSSDKYTADLEHTKLENEKLRKDLTAGEDTSVTTDLQGAAAAIKAGADPDAVRQRFLDTHPTQRRSIFEIY